MRLAIISDSHTKSNIEFILEYLRKKQFELKIDIIIINGDVLGENEIREGYGYSFSKSLFQASLDRNSMLTELFPDFDSLAKLKDGFSQGIKDDAALAQTIKEYVSHRYDYLFKLLLSFSEITDTYFNIGTYESPLHYNVLKELAFLLDIPEPYIRSLALLSNYRETFQEFQTKFKDPRIKKLRYLAGSTIMPGETLIGGIPGFNHSSGPMDSMSEFQEKMASDFMGTVTRQLSYVNRLILVNQTQGKLRKDPFSFRPASQSVREFMEKCKQKLRQKVFVQSYHHFMTTHFYEAAGFHFMLSNSAVNNCLFNMLDIGNRLVCYDVDPKLDIVRQLKTYNYNIADIKSPQERLALNYENPDEVIKQRNLSGCYYM
ncbi:MAG: metallophosphoesterase [archaeon]